MPKNKISELVHANRVNKLEISVNLSNSFTFPLCLRMKNPWGSPLDMACYCHRAEALRTLLKLGLRPGEKANSILYERKTKFGEGSNAHIRQLNEEMIETIERFKNGNIVTLLSTVGGFPLGA